MQRLCAAGGRGEPRPEAAAPSIPPGFDLALVDAVDGPLGLAVSGGGDSVALAVLLAELRPALRPKILTVNHGLRREAVADAEFVEGLGARLGLQVVRLDVEGGPVGSLQAWAREARYALLSRAAAEHGLAAVATAHTLDDQAETVLMRLGRGSSLSGLAAIRPRAVIAGLPVVRPLLGVRRAALRAALRARSVGWREDPSNDDPRFDRARVRAAMPALAAAGLAPERIAAAAGNLARAADAIDAAVAAALAEAVEDRAGAVVLPRSVLALPEEVRLHVLSAAATRAGGKAPRFEALAGADRALAQDRAATLGRACVRPLPRGIVLWREARGIAPLALRAGESGVFDRRYRVAVPENGAALLVAAIGQASRKLPAVACSEAMATAPGIFVDGALVAAPTLGVRLQGVPKGIAHVVRLP